MQQSHYAELLQPLLRQATGYAHSILRNRDQAQDAVQQAALRGLERLRTFDDTRSFREWWFAILRNCCIDLLRADKSAKHVSTDALDLEDPRLTDARQSEQETDAGEQLMRAIACLSDDHQEILRLKYFADLSYKELAAALNIPQGTVMSRLHLARIALAARLTTKMKEEE